jgi:hypothetical protein
VLVNVTAFNGSDETDHGEFGRAVLSSFDTIRGLMNAKAL